MVIDKTFNNVAAISGRCMQDVITLLPQIPCNVPQFFISSKVQWRLDFQLWIWDQYWACSWCHYNATHLSNMQAHPISCWSDQASCVWSGESGTADSYHPQRPCIICLPNLGAVPWSLNHFANSVSAAFHIIVADTSGHHTIFNLSSWGSWHQGQWLKVQNFHQTMFCLCEKWPDMNLVTHHHCEMGTSDMAHFSAGQSILFHRTKEMCWHFCQ